MMFAIDAGKHILCSKITSADGKMLAVDVGAAVSFCTRTAWGILLAAQLLGNGQTQDPPLPQETMNINLPFPGTPEPHPASKQRKLRIGRRVRSVHPSSIKRSCVPAT